MPLPTSGDLTYNRANLKDYVVALQGAGAECVEVDLSSSIASVREVARECDGILLPGSPADVEPSAYGQAREEGCAAADPARERTDTLLLDEAFAQRKPVFGICFGTQMINTFCGGTLLQDLAPMPVNHAAGKAVSVAHPVEFFPEGFLAGIAGSTRAEVNSSHHQAVGVCAPELTVTARCPFDAVVEAVEGKDLAKHFLLGVQWHPERSVLIDPFSRRLFQAFVDRAAQWRRTNNGATWQR